MLENEAICRVGGNSSEAFRSLITNPSLPKKPGRGGGLKRMGAMGRAGCQPIMLPGFAMKGSGGVQSRARGWGVRFKNDLRAVDRNTKFV